MDIPRMARPVQQHRVVYDAPFQGAHDANLSRQVSGYVLRCCPNSAQYNFAVEEFAPKATILAKDTWYDFSHSNSVDSCTFDVPWHHQTQMSGIRMKIRVVTASRGGANMRVQVDELTDTVASSEGTAQTQLATGLSSFHWWCTTRFLGNVVRPGSAWLVATYTLYIFAPTMPAAGTRRVCVRPQIKHSAIADILVGLAGDPEWFIESMYLTDIPDEDEHA